MRARVVHLVIAVAAALALGAAPAAAWERTLGFETAAGPGGTQLAGQGVILDSAVAGGPARRSVLRQSGSAHGGTGVLAAEACANGGVGYPGISLWMPERPTRITFWVRGLRTSGRTPLDQTAYMQWDAPDFAVPQGESSVSLIPADGIWHQVVIDATPQVHAEQLNIFGLASDLCLEIDDLVIGADGTADRGPVIDVGDALRWDGSVVGQGQELVSSARLIRLGGASGRVRVALGPNPSVGVLPNGFSGEVSPTELAGSAVVQPLTVRTRVSAAAEPGLGSWQLSATPIDATAGEPLLYLSTEIVSRTTQLGTPYDLRIRSIEVNQGTQWLDDRGVPRPFIDDPGRPVDYVGVRLVEGLPAAVRVYVDAGGVPERFAFGRFSVRLRGFRGGVELPGSPLVPWGVQPKAWQLGLPVVREDRADPLRSSTFRLPYSWRRGTISLRAELVPPWTSPSAVLPPPCTTFSCVRDDQFTLQNVRFGVLKERIIAPVAVTATGEAGPPDVTDLFERSLRLLPGAAEQLVWYTKPIATVDVTKIKASTDPKLDKNDAYGDAVLQWVVKSWDRGTSDFVVGINSVERGVSMTNISALPDWPAVSVVNPVRPLTSVAHEVGHGLGLPHADSACGGGGTWPPDGRGHTYGVGLDLAAPRADGHYTPMVDSADTTGNLPWLDLMSYCADIDEQFGARNANVWISPQNWDRIIGNWNSPAPRARVRGPVSARLTVVGLLRDGELASVVALPERRVALAPPSGQQEAVVQMEARNAAGQVVAGGVMQSFHVHVHPLPGDPPNPPERTLVIGDLPAAGVARIGLTGDGGPLAAIARGATSPAVRILAPRRGARLPAKGTFTVRFAAGPGAFDLATVEASEDGGRTWHGVWSGTVTRARIPVSAVGGTTRARSA